ncbi:MAG: protease modulator HflC [Alphaproteobacteria bacterium]|nr:protease modulator HflC [Alphaproteobacteria bacterium]
MQRMLLPLLFIAAAVVFVLANTLVVVPQTQQALILRFGEIQRVVNQEGGTTGPGLYLKAPFVENQISFDRRNMHFTLQEQRVIASDQETLIVDAFIFWRIVDPRAFYQAAQTEEAGRQRLQALTEAAMRRQLGAVDSSAIISQRRAELMTLIASDVNREAGPNLGVRVVDVRLRQADLPAETQDRVFQRMATEREQVAAATRAAGQEQAARIIANAEREATVIRATAREEAEVIRGEGDAQRARIFAESFGRDPDFAAFYRSMRAYEAAMPEGTQMVIPPDNDFFRYFQNSSGRN